MTAQRPLSPFESRYFAADTRLGSVPIGGMPLFIGTTVHGAIDAGVLRRVLAELAAGHVLLRCRVVTAEGVSRFEEDENYRPPLEERAGEADEYWELVNSRLDWEAGLFRAVLLRGAAQTRIVLIIHHGISDGRSAFALLDEMWRRYSARLAGTPVPLNDSDRELAGGVDELLARVTTDAEVDEFLAQLREAAAGPAADPADTVSGAGRADSGSAARAGAGSPAGADSGQVAVVDRGAGAARDGEAGEGAGVAPEPSPSALPCDGDGVGDPGGRLALRRIELSASQTSGLVSIARAQGISVNSLLGGAALAAVRGQIPASGAVLLMCGHAADLRPELSPRLPASTILNCASGTGTPAPVDHDTDPAALGAIIDATMRQLLDTRFPALFMRASQRDLDAPVAAMLSAPPAIALSNMGRLPAHSLPAGVEFVRDEVFAMAPGMPPKMTIFTVGDRLTIQVEYDTAEHSHSQMGRVAEAMSDQLARLTRPAAVGG